MNQQLQLAKEGPTKKKQRCQCYVKHYVDTVFKRAMELHHEHIYTDF